MLLLLLLMMLLLMVLILLGRLRVLTVPQRGSCLSMLLMLLRRRFTLLVLLVLLSVHRVPVRGDGGLEPGLVDLPSLHCVILVSAVALLLVVAGLGLLLLN